MASAPDRFLSSVGGILLAAGCIAGFLGGLHGLAEGRPSLVVASVLVLMGYGVVGYLLLDQGARHVRVVLPLMSLLVVATVFLVDQVPLFDDNLARFLLYPGLSYLLAYAGGAMVVQVLSEHTAATRWRGPGAQTLGSLFLAAGAAPVWSAFLLADLSPLAEWSRVLVTLGGILAAVACVTAGFAPTRDLHPRFAVLGAGVGFLACVYYLFHFMSWRGGAREVAGLGQAIVLLGLLATGLFLAIATVAWIQSEQGTAEGQVQAAP